MRDIAFNGDRYQTIIIFVIALLYFLLSYSLRGSMWWGGVVYLVFVLLFIATIMFFTFSQNHSKRNAFTQFYFYVFLYTYTHSLLVYIQFDSFLLFFLHRVLCQFWVAGFSVFFIAYSSKPFGLETYLGLSGYPFFFTLGLVSDYLHVSFVYDHIYSSLPSSILLQNLQGTFYLIN